MPESDRPAGETAACPNAGRYNDCHGTGRYWYDEDTPMAGQSPAGWRNCGAGCRLTSAESGRQEGS